MGVEKSSLPAVTAFSAEAKPYISFALQFPGRSHVQRLHNGQRLNRGEATSNLTAITGFEILPLLFHWQQYCLLKGSMMEL
ncbi:hypothetical protein [Geomesophilobacter sediminis]|uniref:Uncharacterized protein n=1 Tax=Geomesophilobacter sediminis TaxID=2798584 RepID=A0A8J7LY87_9BACT|nr:hypothetical protein [Geomesophilobacter sediminis]MBJ6724297.1 hypothetical protein [Geomesophilobacter sediminis]